MTYHFLRSGDQCSESGWSSAHSVKVARRQQGLSFLTLGPSGYYPLMETGPELPRGAEQALICCKATRWMDRTAEFGMD